MPGVEAVNYQVEVMHDDVHVLEMTVKPRFPDSPWSVIQRMAKHSGEFASLCHDHREDKLVWLQKPLDASNGGHDTRQFEILSRFARFHELHFHSDGFESKYIIEMRSLTNLTRPPTADQVGTRVVTIDLRLGEDELRKSANRMRRCPDGACAYCGGIDSSKQCACALVRYCNDRCQRAHWRVHKADCKVSKMRAASYPPTTCNADRPLDIQSELDALISSEVIQELRASEEDTLVVVRSANEY